MYPFNNNFIRISIFKNNFMNIPLKIIYICIPLKIIYICIPLKIIYIHIPLKIIYICIPLKIGSSSKKKTYRQKIKSL